MRILLVKPPIRACRVEIGRHMPIGLAYLASALRDEGHEVAIFDALAHTTENHIVDPADYTAADREKILRHPRWRHLVHWGSSWATISAVLRDFTPDILGVSCMFTPYYETAYELARLAKRVVPDAWVILGGQHPTAVHPHALAEPAFDLLVRGEAERSLVCVVRALAGERDLTAVPGVVFRCGAGLCRCPGDRGGAHVTPQAPWIDELDELTLPASDLIDFALYDRRTTLITSRGCPFSCSFCTVHATVGKRFRARSPVAVVDEIEHYLRDHGVRRFSIEDDNFTFDIDRVHAICREIQRRELDVELYLPNGMTVVKLSTDLVDAMARSGFKNLFLGLETTDPARLRKIRKGFTSLEKVTTGANWFTGRGVAVSASLIVGLLGHGLDQIARDCVNLASAGIRYGVNPFYPIPGSADYQTCLAAGLIGPDTELALYEGFNFAIGSDRLSAAEVYWAWVAGQALSQWPGYVLDGRAAGDEVTVAEAVERLVGATAAQAPGGAEFETLAIPVRADGTEVTVRADGCFCSLQQVRERVSGAGPADFCSATADIIAAGVGLYLGRPMSGVQLTGMVNHPKEGCSFRLHAGAGAEATRVHAAFTEELDRNRDRRLVEPVGRGT